MSEALEAPVPTGDVGRRLRDLADGPVPPTLADVLRDIAADADRSNSRSPMQAWQPIETAPKDGTLILCSDGGDQFTARWTDDGWYYGGCDLEIYVDIGAMPTRWMPLPAPP